MRLHWFVFIVAVLVLASSCARRKTAVTIPSTPPLAPQKVNIGDVERGIASWYGEPYHGRRAANGEVFDMTKLTAAHRTMPFGTWLRVENESNHRNVNVRVTDRGPFVADRIVDLSRHAAEELAMIGAGLARVKLTVIAPPRGEIREEYGVQIAAWEDPSRSEAMRRELLGKFDPVRVVPDSASPIHYRVIVGVGTKDDASILLARLRQAGYRGFVLRLDTFLITLERGAASPQ